MGRSTTKKETIHFIGIGGIGVSSLARFFLARGFSVSGSDIAASEITRDLQKEGARIVVGKHLAGNIPKGTKRVVYTAAVRPSNPELTAAKRRRIKTLTYAEAIGEISKHMKTITVSGSHGKSTTTALAALVLEEGQLDPTVIIGTKLNEFGGRNFRKGRGPWLVLEADEWNKSFLRYKPLIALVTNIDAEHLDTYKTVKGVEDTFRRFLKKVPKNGKIIANADDPRLARVASKFGARVIWYSLKSRDADVIRKTLRIPGEHNISNALAALVLGRYMGIREPDMLRALSRFTGAWRRFEFKGMLHGAYVYTDYGHHPREIQATLQAARSRFPMRRIWCVYQPHQYQRLAYLWDDFITAFDEADRVTLLPVYDVAGRETRKAKEAVSSARLALELRDHGKRVSYVETMTQAENMLRVEARKGDVVLIMGAGDIYDLAVSLAKFIEPPK